MTDAQRIRDLELDLATLRQQQAETQRHVEEWKAAATAQRMTREGLETALAETQQARDMLEKDRKELDRAYDAKHAALKSAEAKFAALQQQIAGLLEQWRAQGHQEMAEALGREMHAAAGLAAMRLHNADQLAAVLLVSTPGRPAPQDEP